MKKILLTILSLATLTIAKSQIDTTGLFGVYNFNTGTQMDGIEPRAIGSFNNATFVADRFSNPAAALSFSGTASYLDLGIPNKANVTTGLTISAWIKLNNVSGQKAIVSKWQGSMNNDQYILMVDGNKLRFAIGRQGFSANGILGNTILLANTWYHVSATWNTSGEHTIYVNGVQDVSSTLSNFTSINSTSNIMLTIGAETSSASRYFNGTIDEVLMYNRSLSATEINNIYNAESSIPNGLVSKYDFNLQSVKDIQNFNDGGMTNQVFTTDRFGNTSGALSFTPTGSFLNLEDRYDAFATGTSGKFAYSFWVNFSAINNAYQIIMAKSSDAGCNADERQFLLRLNASNKLEITSYGTLTSGNNVSLTGNTTLSSNQWYHVVLNYDATDVSVNQNSRFQLHLNNTQEPLTQTSIAGSGIGNGILNGPAKLAVGAYVKSNGSPCQNVQRLNGAFDDLHIYNKRLSAFEIDSLYNVGNPIGLKNFGVTSHIVYPNPFNNQINLNLDSKSTIYVYSIDGKEMFTSTFEKGTNTINTQEWSIGMYIIKTISEKGISSKKLIKQ